VPACACASVVWCVWACASEWKTEKKRVHHGYVLLCTQTCKRVWTCLHGGSRLTSHTESPRNARAVALCVARGLPRRLGGGGRSLRVDQGVGRRAAEAGPWQRARCTQTRALDSKLEATSCVRPPGLTGTGTARARELWVWGGADACDLTSPSQPLRGVVCDRTWSVGRGRGWYVAGGPCPATAALPATSCTITSHVGGKGDRLLSA